MPKFCPNCGTGLVDDQKYCRKCGSSLMTAELTSRHDSIALDSGSAQKVARADTVRNLGETATGEMIPGQEGRTRVMGSVQTESSPVGGTQRIDESAAHRASGPIAEGAAASQAAAFSGQSGAKKGFPVVAVLSVVAVFLIAALALGYWLYSRSHTKSSSIAAAPEAGTQPQTVEAGSPAPQGASPDASNSTSAGGSFPGGPAATGDSPSGRAQKDKGSPQGPQAEGGGVETAKRGEGEATTTSKPIESNKNAASSTVTPARTSSADDHIKAGLKAFDARDYSMAAAEYMAAARLQPSNSDVHYLLGLAYEKLRRPADALAEYQKCTSGPYASVSKQHVKRLSKSVKD